MRKRRCFIDIWGWSECNGDDWVVRVRGSIRTRARGVWQNAMETRGFDGLRKEREESGPVDLRGVNRTRKKRQLRANASFKTWRQRSADAMQMMRWWNARHEQDAKQKNKKPTTEENNISHLRKRQELELRIWKVVSEALQHSTPMRGSHPEI